MWEYIPYIEHHGILGQKWGVRRYQNYDGSLTRLGLSRLRNLYDGVVSGISLNSERSIQNGSPRDLPNLKSKINNLNRYNNQNSLQSASRGVRIRRRRTNRVSRGTKAGVSRPMQRTETQNSSQIAGMAYRLKLDHAYGYSKARVWVDHQLQLRKMENEWMRSEMPSHKKLVQVMNNRLKDIDEEYNALKTAYNEHLQTESPKSYATMPRKDREMSQDEDMARVNPYFSEDYEHKINCAYCSYAYELRRRGYDVRADLYDWGDGEGEEDNSAISVYSWYSHDGRSYSTDLLTERYESCLKEAGVSKSEMFKNPELQVEIYSKVFPGLQGYVTESSKNNLTATQMAEKEMLSQGDGARGQMMLYWKNGGGHSVVYEVNDGKVIIRDCQTNQVLNLEDYTQYTNTFYFYRTDNESVSGRVLGNVKPNVEKVDVTNRYIEDIGNINDEDLAYDLVKAGFHIVSDRSYNSFDVDTQSKGLVVQAPNNGPYYWLDTTNGDLMLIDKDEAMKRKRGY